MPRHTRSGGYVLIWLAITMTAMIAFVSLAVDLGRVEVAKTQLRRAADAAAQYAAVGISDGTAAARAIAAANDNLVDGTPLVLLNSDVTTGRWSSGALVFSGTYDSVRVSAVRAASRSTGIPLLFAQVLGQRTCDMHVTVTARVNSVVPVGIVGITSVTMSGNLSDSYNSANGATSYTTMAGTVNVESNGNISLSGGSTVIHGNAFPGIGHSVSASGGSTVTGTTTPLTTPLSFPNATAGSAATTNNNGSLPVSYFNSGNRNFNVSGGATATVPGGTYYLNDLTLSGGSSLIFTGPVTLYLTGTLNFSGGSVGTSANLPANLIVNMCSSSDVTLSSSSAIYAEVYAPQSKLTLSGSAAFGGSLISNILVMSGSASVHYDNSLTNSGLGITLVQ